MSGLAIFIKLTLVSNREIEKFIYEDLQKYPAKNWEYLK